jgi:hypothetical protein
MDISRVHEHLMNEIYRSVFPTLAHGQKSIQVSKEEAEARYDHKEGIDVILTMDDGLRLTVQEKLLTTHFDTVTFEERKKNGEPGGWYYGTSQLYIVAYNRQYPKSLLIEEYMLMNFTTLKVIDSIDIIDWKFNKNKKDGRTEDFRYLRFKEVPKECIVSQRIKKPLEFEFPF